jgi:hypothetical protein
MTEPKPRKIVRSYRLVFRRRWRIFRLQGWRIPLPGGIELRLLGYWLASLAASFILARLPPIGIVVSALPPSLRLLALPLAAAWALSRWEVDGRPPHRALASLIGWSLRPRSTAALRRVPLTGECFAPLAEVALAPDLGAPTYPRGSLTGPARLLLRYPARAVAERRGWNLHATGAPAMHSGRIIELPAGRSLSFEGEP